MAKKRRSAAWSGGSTPEDTSMVDPPPAASPPKKKATKKKAATKGKKTKAQLHKEMYSEENIDTTMAQHMRSMVTDIQKECRDPTVATLKDAGKFVIGIPCVGFAMEYLLCNTVIPLEKVIQLYGPRGIGKSGLFFELVRIFRKHHGIGNLCEHETKFNPDWAMSHIGYDEEADCLGVIPCDSINDWQKHLMETNKKVRKIMLGDSKTKGSGRIFPYIQGVDSIMGKPFKETTDNIEKQGFAGRGHAIEAMSITRFITSYASKLRRWPFLLVCINHLKIKKVQGGPDEENRSGGQTIDFQGAFEIKVKRAERIRAASVDGNKLYLTCEKNSYGPDKRQIPVNVIWYDEDNPETGERQQRTVWDWDAATVMLILENFAKKRGAKWTQAKEITGLVEDSKSMAHSRLLGYPDKTPHWKLGAAIHKNAGMMRELRRLFEIRERKVFRPGVDYEQQILELKQEIAAGNPEELGLDFDDE